MNDYIYRIDTQSGLKKIQDREFRARRWIPGTSYSFPHKLLAEVHSTLPPTEALYRICFYTSQPRAEQSLHNDFKWLGPSHLLRCPKNEVLGRGFKESWDDGFKEGDAYLFWISEPLSPSNAELSSTGIATDLFEVMKEGQWHSLPSYLAQIVVASSPPSRPSTSQTLAPPVPRKTNWWKFW